MNNQTKREPYQKKYTDVLGHRMAYIEVGQGDPIVFLHGNPTSSYLWRNVIPYLEPLGRCIAPDLIGMGDSDKLPGSGRYRYVEHRTFLEALLVGLGVTNNVTLVLHDWGSALGFNWAFSHPDAIRGIAYMEAIVRPLSWQEWPEGAREIFQALRGPQGEEMVLQQNLFVERILPTAILRTLSEAEMATYRKPFLEIGEGRRPTLTWPHELPIEGEPADVCAIVTQYGRWLANCDIPKLFINAEPGAILIGSQREFARSWPNQVEVSVSGRHFVQEDSADAIGAAIAAWYQLIRPRNA
jgi:haloalkane dehalogenase